MEQFYNIKAETDILGGILTNNDNLIEVIDLIKAEDFYKGTHKALYRAMVALYSQEKPIDITNLLNLFKNDLSEVGGFSEITGLLNNASPHFSKSHAKIIKENSDLRKLQETLYKTLKDLKGKSFKDAMQDAQNKIIALNSTNEALMVNDEALMVITLKTIEENFSRGGGILGLKGNIDTLDKAINGFQKKKLYVAAGRPGMGKSAFALNLVENISRNHNVLYYSLEMPEEELGLRRLAMNALIDTAKIERGNMTDLEWERIIRKSNDISRHKCLTCCKPKIHLTEIRGQLKKMQLTAGIDLLVIDHTGYMDLSGMGDTLREQTSNLYAELKNLSKDFDIPVLALSQLSRAVEQRADKRPMLSDLKESSGIEENADVVMLLYRDEYYNPNTQDARVIEVNIAKQRGGRTGVIKLGWQGDMQLITDIYRGGK